MSVGPRSKERPADAGVTLVGGLDSEAPATVDGGGLVTPANARWSIDWWIGAADRWYFPSRESTIRQRRIGAGPVIETSMRVPSGDVAAAVYAVVVGDDEVTVVEVTNRSKTAVALALALRPYRADGMTLASRFEIADTTTLMADGREAVLLPRPPAHVRLSADVDLADVLDSAGVAVDALPLEAAATSTAPATAGPDTGSRNGSDPDRSAVSGHDANGVAVYPLPHGTSLRFVVLAAGAGAAGGAAVGVAPNVLPDATSAARGWDAVVAAGGRFEFPDPAVTELANGARARLLSGDTRPPSDPVNPDAYGPILAALAAGGHDLEARRWLVALARSFPTSIPDPARAVAILSGIGPAAALAGEPGLTDALLEPAAQLTYLVERAVSSDSDGDHSVLAAALDGLARLLLVAGQPDAARPLVERLASLGRRPGTLPPFILSTPTEPTGPSDGSVRDWWRRLDELAAQARPSGRFGLDDDVELAAHYWLTARSMLINDRLDGVIDVLPAFPSSWRGGGVEVHGAPTLYGPISFALRWHGARPALLWDRSTAVDGPSPMASGAASGIGQDQGRVELRCPSLDPTWSTTEVRGEVLLAGSAEVLPSAPAPGDSFQ